MTHKIIINIADQNLKLFSDDNCVFDVAISTATNGAGEANGSNCTPRGRHIIRAKIGGGCLPNTVFVGRRPTGEIFTPEFYNTYPDRDWILTRIMWLSGCELGRNRLGSVDTMRRYIYLHGTPDSVAVGEPGSHGCIRMKNKDIIQLFDMIKVGVGVEIVE